MGHLMIRLKTLIISTFLIFVFTIQSSANEQKIFSLLENSGVLIFGEKRGKPESARLVSDVVEAFTAMGNCVNVGLEISSEEQKNIDGFINGNTDISNIRINTFVTHKEYRNMLRSFKDFKAAGRCIRVFGVDVPDTVPIEKNVWMSRIINSLVGDSPMLVLIGNRHTFKNVQWKNDENKKTVLAQNLKSNGVNVGAVMQYWEKQDCISKIADFLDTENPYTGVYVNDIIKPLSMKPPSQVSEITDGVIVWNCGTLSAEINKQVEIEKKTADIDVDPVINKPTIETDRKKIEKSIKRGIPMAGMTTEDVIKTLGEPKKKSGVNSSGYEKWGYECYADEGYYYECNNLTFENNVLIRIADWEI